MNTGDAEALLGRWLPAAAVPRVCAWLLQRKARLRIARHRNSKLGDYRPPQRGVPQHSISVGGDLGKGMFLWVLLHEMAHLENHLHHPHSEPHGYEWQAEYAALITAYADYFDPPVQPLMRTYAARLPLNRRLLAAIERQLREADRGRPLLVLADLQPGTLFKLVGRGPDLFRADERRRTRWLCTHLPSGRRYLVSANAEVQRADAL